MPVCGPFKVISQKGKAWKLQKLSTSKNYVVHPDFIVQRPSVVVNEKSKFTPNQEESSDNDNDLITISHDKQTIHINLHLSGENQPTHKNTESKTNLEPLNSERLQA